MQARHQHLSPDKQCRCTLQHHLLPSLRHIPQHGLRATSRRIDNASTTETTASVHKLMLATEQQAFGASSTSQQKEQLLQLVTELKDLQQAAQKALSPTEGPLSGVSQAIPVQLSQLPPAFNATVQVMLIFSWSYCVWARPLATAVDKRG